MRCIDVKAATGTLEQSTRALFALVAILIAGCDSNPPTVKAVDRKEVEAVIAERSRAYDEFVAELEKAKTEDAFRRAQRKRPGPVPGAERLLPWAEAHPEDPLATELLAVIVQHGRFERDAQRAAEILARDHHDRLSGKSFTETAGRILIWPMPITEGWLRAFLDRSGNRETRALAGLTLAQHKKWLSERADDPDSRDWVMSDDWLKTMKESFGESSVEYLATLDPQAQSEEAIALFERLIEELGDVDLGGATVARVARPMLIDIKHFSIGRTAPEIAAADLEGQPMKLSDYRGKVVVLCFWASWCRPCMEMVPHEKALVKRLEGQPFAFLGVNGDDDNAAARSAVRVLGMNWRSWKNDTRPGKSIADQWNIRAWPTIYVLDGNGVIRHKGLRDERLDAAVDALIRDQLALAPEKRSTSADATDTRRSP